MTGNYNLRAIISAVDNLSPVLRAQVRVLNTWKRQFESVGKNALPMAAGFGAAMAIPTMAFMQAEDASVQLQSTLLNNKGIAAGLEAISKVAVDLGNKLPGTTADFMGMSSQLKSLGVNAEAIAGGALKATAYLAVIGKPLGVTYDSAAEAIGKLGNAFGIAAGDLVPFADTLQRTLHLGVSLSEMQFAMAKEGAMLKALGLQGLGVAKEMVPLNAMLIAVGMSGETAGTGIEKMIGGAVKGGKFKGIPNLVKDLEKFGKLKPPERMAKFIKLFGEEGARVAMVVSSTPGGYNAMAKKMEEQADMQQRIALSLGTLTNIWDAATGTFTNAMVAFSKANAPELKKVAENIGDISGKLQKWADENPEVINVATKMAGAFVGVKLAAWAAAAGIGLMTTAMKANPFVALLQTAVVIAPLIIDNWDTLTAKFSSGWDNCVKGVLKVWDGVVDGILLSINAAKDALNSLLSLFSDFQIPDIKLPKMPDFNQIGAKTGSFVYDIASAPSSGMRLPGAANPVEAQRQIKLPAVPKSIETQHQIKLPVVPKPIEAQRQIKLPEVPKIQQYDGFISEIGKKQPSALQGRKIVQAAAAPAQAQPVKGSIEINFNNAPAGMRVEPAKTSGPVSVRSNVGYRSFAAGTP